MSYPFFGAHKEHCSIADFFCLIGLLFWNFKRSKVLLLVPQKQTAQIVSLVSCTQCDKSFHITAIVFIDVFFVAKHPPGRVENAQQDAQAQGAILRGKFRKHVRQ